MRKLLLLALVLPGFWTFFSAFPAAAGNVFLGCNITQTGLFPQITITNPGPGPIPEGQPLFFTPNGSSTTYDFPQPDTSVAQGAPPLSFIYTLMGTPMKNVPPPGGCTAWYDDTVQPVRVAGLGCTAAAAGDISVKVAITNTGTNPIPSKTVIFFVPPNGKETLRSEPIAASLATTKQVVLPSANIDSGNCKAWFYKLRRTCEALAQQAIPHTANIASVTVAKGGFPLGNIANNRDFCRVTTTPSLKSNVNIEVWMPSSDWNGKYLGTGNLAFAGAIFYLPLVDGLNRGYAVANTDMGTSPQIKPYDDGSTHGDQRNDWGHLATNAMTLAAKQIIQTFYGVEPQHSYFFGCSTGGGQGLMEAQRYPTDYDGIIAGAPGNNRTHLHTAFLWSFRKAQDAKITSDTLKLLTKSVLKACSKAVSSDQFLNDPRDCKFKPDDLACPTSDTSNCLTADQVKAVQALYDGPSNPSNGHLVYPGWPRGSESIVGNADTFLGKAGAPAFDGLFKWVFGKTWTWTDFKFDNNFAGKMNAVDGQLSVPLNAMNPDLQKFKDAGGKLILYHGWADAVVSAYDTINYYERIVTKQGGSAKAALAKTQTFARLFLAPGLAHCADGPGPNNFADTLFQALDTWVVGKTPPEKIIATKFEDADPSNPTKLPKVVMTRPLCPYPRRAKLNNSTKPNDASGYVCEEAGPYKTHMPANEYLK